jgi:hypothetical protein
MELKKYLNRKKMDKFKKIYEENIPSNIIVDKESIMNCMEMAYKMGVIDTESKYDKIKVGYESIIEDLVDDSRCVTVKTISTYNKKKMLNNL